jgi:hypothetical protein
VKAAELAFEALPNHADLLLSHRILLSSPARIVHAEERYFNKKFN